MYLLFLWSYKHFGQQIFCFVIYSHDPLFIIFYKYYFQLLSTDFIETSALDGTNVETALLLLVGFVFNYWLKFVLFIFKLNLRAMMKSEDDHLKQTALILQSLDKKKWKCMSCGN